MSDENTIEKQVDVARKAAKLCRDQEEALRYELEVARRECERQRGRADAFREMKEAAERDLAQLRAHPVPKSDDEPDLDEVPELPDGWEWSDIPSKDRNRCVRLLYACNREGHTVELWRDAPGGLWLEADGADLGAVLALLARHRAFGGKR